jgi:dTDP-3-amino-2,3,6-trideoxy-4-keto-D-glucose/dTDP-3-amino-3,4,6-trideoxy-alpha-D-glucose/dTDP-2,6-dideoxy-D-kanosamine transaminase
MKVKYIDLPKQFKDENLWQEIKKVFETCQFIQGPEVERFEGKFATICGTPFALGLNSGTDAMFLALKALDIGPGDEVITVPNSFIATAGAIIAAGAKPVFVDVAADYNMDVNWIEEAITARTKAILPVHLTGNPADMGKIGEIAKKKNLFIIEDAAQAIMASIDGKPVGSFGDAGCFSLHPLKNLNVCGDGGALTTQSRVIYEKVKCLRNHGLKNRDEIEFFGYNSRLDTLQAIVAEYGIKNLKAIQEKRQKNAQIYDRGLKDLNEYVTIPPRRKNVEQVFHTYVIRVQKRAQLIRFLEENGVETKIHYPIPIHLQKPCQELGYQKGDFPTCEKQSAEILSLPIHQHLERAHLEYVIEQIKNFYQRG